MAVACVVEHHSTYNVFECISHSRWNKKCCSCCSFILFSSSQNICSKDLLAISNYQVLELHFCLMYISSEVKCEFY